MRAVAAAVMVLVFVDELACLAAFGVWGWHIGGPVRLLAAAVLPGVAMIAWFLLASPKARYGGPLARPATKVVVFGLGSLALWHAGHPRWSVVLLVSSIIVNVAAHMPATRRAARDLGFVEGA